MRRWGRVACVMRRLWSPLARSDTLKKSSCVSLGTTSRVVDLNVSKKKFDQIHGSRRNLDDFHGFFRWF